MVVTRKAKEKTLHDNDQVLIGVLLLLTVLLTKFPHCKTLVSEKLNLTDVLLNECLFEIPRNVGRAKKKEGMPPKCKSALARQQAFRLLNILARNNLENLKKVLAFITKLHQNATWRTKRKNDWDILQIAHEKSSTGFVGLKNLGCICYMISLMQ